MVADAAGFLPSALLPWAVCHTDPASRKLYFIARKRTSRADPGASDGAGLTSPEVRKVNPFTNLRQWRFSPRIALHCSNIAATQHGLRVKWLDKIFALG
jgi:hypothetical protein